MNFDMFLKKLEEIKIDSDWYTFGYDLESKNAHNDTIVFYVKSDAGVHIIDKHTIGPNDDGEVLNCVYKDLLNDLITYGYNYQGKIKIDVEELIRREMKGLLLKYEAKADYIEENLLSFEEMEEYFRRTNYSVKFNLNDEDYTFKFLDKYRGQNTDSVYYPTLWVRKKEKINYGGCEELETVCYTIPSKFATYYRNFDGLGHSPMDNKLLTKVFNDLPKIMEIIRKEIKEHME